MVPNSVRLMGRVPQMSRLLRGAGGAAWECHFPISLSNRLSLGGGGEGGGGGDAWALNLFITCGAAPSFRVGACVRGGAKWLRDTFAELCARVAG